MPDQKAEKYKKLEQHSSFSVSFSNLILTGLSGCGKSEIGRHLARLMGWGFLDLDLFMTKVTGKTPSEIIHEDSLDVFRKHENRAVNSLRFLKNHIISLGGGTFCYKNNLLLLRKLGLVVWLDVAPGVIARRLASLPEELEKRPLLGKNLPGKTLPSVSRVKELLELQLEGRHSYYEQAHLIVRDSYSSSDIYARKVYRSILGLR